MKLVIFGASGRTGRQLLDQALAQEHAVTVFVRDPNKLGLEHDRLQVVQGDVHDLRRVSAAVAGQDAVLSALGPAPPQFDTMTVGARHLIAAMGKHEVLRLITLTGAGVPDPEDQPKLFDRVLRVLLQRISPQVLADAQRHVEQVRASHLDWTIVRVPMLREGPRTGQIRVGWVGVNVGFRISRGDVADFMLQQLTDTQYIRQAPVISN